MTSNAEIPNASTPDAPIWQPLPPADEAAASGDPAIDDTAAARGDTGGTSGAAAVEFAPGSGGRQRASAKGSRAGSTTALLMVGALVAVGGIGFAIGHNLSAGGGSNSSTSGQNDFRPSGSFNPGQFGANASGAPGRGLGGASTVTGTVESVTADSMTIKLASGQTVTVAIGSGTTYHSQTSASSSTVTTGSTVVVQTAGESQAAGAAASPGTTGRTATDVTVTSK